MKIQDVLEKKQIRHLSIARQISISFFIVIFTGGVLLSLPIANAAPAVSFIDHLFMSTSAVCVTGLVSVVPVAQYTTFGHVVLIMLIQIGGLSFLTLIAVTLLMMKKKLTLANRLKMKDSLNIRDSLNIPLFIIKVIKYTFLFEGIGAIIMSFEFIPTYGFGKGLWMGVFHSISAFCNAGFDIIGDANLAPYVGNATINITIMSLIIIGGIGFAVWFDIEEKIKPLLKRKIGIRRFYHSLDFHSRIAIPTTFALVFGGALIIALLEWNNKGTFANLNGTEKTLAALMQSVTLRTAGFCSVDMGALTSATKLIMMAWMFIGGSPGGTAGGIKTVTFVVVIAAVVSMVKNREYVTIGKRSISDSIVKKALMVFGLGLTVVITATFILTLTEPNLSVLQLAFEVVSGFCTVGLTSAATPFLSAIGKIIIILCMYIGRVGPATLITSFIRSESQTVNAIRYPDGNVLIG